MRGVRRRAVAAALALVAGVSAAPALAVPTDPPVAVVTVAACPSTGVAVPADYLGLSVEWSMVERWFGTSRAGHVRSMVTLLRSLGRTGVLRIGGNSQDGYRWRGRGPNHLFEGGITPGMVDGLLEVAARSGWKVVLGLNLRADRPDEAAGLTRYAVQRDRARSLVAVEIGNEPTVYFGSDYDGYVARVFRYTQALDADPVTRGVPIVGPALANRVDLEKLRRMRTTFPERMPFATWHHYANRPSITRLLGDDVELEWEQRLEEVAQAAGPLRTRMGEGNSVGRGGLRGVSDVSGSAAWLSQSVLSGAAAGLAGYNVHSWDGHFHPAERYTSWYTPFVVRHGRTLPRPGVYALALLKDLPGSRFCTTTIQQAAGQRLRAHAAVDATGTLRVWLVDKGSALNTGGVLVVPPAGYAGAGRVSRATDPADCTGRDVSVEGARLRPDGTLAWTPAPLDPVPGLSAYSVPLTPCALGLVELRRT